RGDRRYRAVVTRETDDEARARRAEHTVPGVLADVGPRRAPSGDALGDDRLDEDVLHRLEEIEETA
ncbi:hypothetical protein NGM37_17790, partial [Streptomyces sp. TRM76130]|nr:hypothetical protein [Streptomyces sp. TRM76130]